MTKKQQKPTKQTKTSKGKFYSTGAIWLMIILVLAFSIMAVFGLYRLGIIKLPDSFDQAFMEKPTSPSNAPAANIANAPEEKESYEAIPREEFATALSKMALPDEYYRNYRIAISSETSQFVTEYYTIKKSNDWWVQTAVNEVIIQTAVCNGGNITVTDNAANTSAKALEKSDENPTGISFEESCGIITLDTLANMIYDIANGNTVTYGGGIADYSLSFTQTRHSGENLFSFSFLCQNGVSEEYTFSFENAVILSASKSFGGKEIYKMEIKDYRNDLSEIDTENLFSVN